MSNHSFFFRKNKSVEDEKKNEDCGVDKDSMMCDKCHKVYAANFKFCPECASPLHPVVDDSKCANCGYEFKEGMKFCPKCGTKKRGCLPK